MADEEVDWGMAGDEDVLDFEGMDADVPVAESVSANKLEPSRAPPAGPRGDSSSAVRVYNTAETQRTGSHSTVAASTSDSQESLGSATQKTTTAASSQPTSSTLTDKASNGQANGNANGPSPNGELPPLPEGWTEIFSRTQQKVFYHNKGLNLTSWDRPVAPERPTTPPLEDKKAQKNGNGDQADDHKDKENARERENANQAKAENRDRKGEDKPGSAVVPTGPSASSTSDSTTAKRAEPDNAVANAYARRRQPSEEKSRSAPGQGSQPKMREWGKSPAVTDVSEGKSGSAPTAEKDKVAADHAKRAPAPTSRQRSRSPSPRPDESKRIRKDSGNNRPPPTGPRSFSNNNNDRSRDPPRDAPRDARDARGSRDPRDPRDVRDARDARDARSARDARDVRDTRSGREERARSPPRRAPPSQAASAARPTPTSNSISSTPAPTGPSAARGVNSAPIANSKWGAGNNRASEGPPARDTEKRDTSQATAPTASSTASATASAKAAGVTSAAEARRAQLREEARKAQELLAKLQQEEEELERKLQDEQKASASGGAGPKAKSSGLSPTRAQGDGKEKTKQELAIELQRKRQKELDAINDARKAAREARFAGSYGLASPAPRSPFPPSSANSSGIRHEDRSYRPSSPSPPRAPAPSSRMDGPGGPPRMNDPRTRRPDSPGRIARRTSPPPSSRTSRPNSPGKGISGESYRPAYRDDRDPREARRDVRDRDADRAPQRLTLAERMGPRRGDSTGDVRRSETLPMSRENDLYTPDIRDRSRPYDRERDRDYDRLRDRERERDIRDREMQRERERERDWHRPPPSGGQRPPWEGRPVAERMSSARR